MAVRSDLQPRDGAVIDPKPAHRVMRELQQPGGIKSQRFMLATDLRNTCTGPDLGKRKCHGAKIKVMLWQH